MKGVLRRWVRYLKLFLGIMVGLILFMAPTYVSAAFPDNLSVALGCIVWFVVDAALICAILSEGEEE